MWYIFQCGSIKNPVLGRGKAEPTRKKMSVMEELLTMDEAAKILRVDYKTVYRLVRTGELPAGKVGRVYRIRRLDLEAYFESSKGKVAANSSRALAPLEDLRCCVTGKRIVSELDIGGYASDTGEPICKDAWVQGARNAGPNGSDTRPKPEGGGP